MIQIFAFIGILVCVWIVSDLLSKKSSLRNGVQENNPLLKTSTFQNNNIIKSELSSFYNFKMNTTLTQKDAILFFLIYISEADSIDNQKENEYIDQLETVLYEHTTYTSQVLEKSIDEMFYEINLFNKNEKTFFIKILSGIIACNLPIKQAKANRVGYIIEKIGMKDEFESIMTDFANN